MDMERPVKFILEGQADRVEITNVLCILPGESVTLRSEYGKWRVVPDDEPARDEVGAASLPGAVYHSHEGVQ